MEHLRRLLHAQAPEEPQFDHPALSLVNGRQLLECAIQHDHVQGGFPRLRRAFAPLWLWGGAQPDFRKDWIFPGLPTEREVVFVRVGGAGDLHPVPDASLVVVDRRQVGVGGLFVEEQRQRLAAPLQAAVELGVGLR